MVPRLNEQVKLVKIEKDFARKIFMTDYVLLKSPYEEKLHHQEPVSSGSW
jgi:hypothetical protein